MQGKALRLARSWEQRRLLCRRAKKLLSPAKRCSNFVSSNLQVCQPAIDFPATRADCSLSACGPAEFLTSKRRKRLKIREKLFKLREGRGTAYLPSLPGQLGSIF